MVGTSFVLDDVTVRYPNGFTALSGADLKIAPGERIALVGPSGAGKTTLLRTLNGTVAASSGAVLVDGTRLDDLEPVALRELRAHIGVIAQSLALVPNVRVVQNIVSGAVGRMSFWTTLREYLWPRRATLERAHALLSRVGIEDKLFQRTDQLSGGQQQRVALARALYQDPRGLLADEPVSSVDPSRARDTVELLTTISRDDGLTLCMSLHDLELAREFFPRLVGLRGGAIVFDVASEDLEPDAVADLYRLTREEMLADGA